MWGDGRRERASDRDAAFNAWVSWRHAAAQVDAAWKDVSRARSATRAAAYAEYCQALRKEEQAAGELGARLAAATACGAHLPAVAA